jgi:hypothetical protein
MINMVYHAKMEIVHMKKFREQYAHCVGGKAVTEKPDCERVMTSCKEKCRWTCQNSSTHYIQWGGIHLHSHSEDCQSWSI